MKFSRKQRFCVAVKGAKQAQPSDSLEEAHLNTIFFFAEAHLEPSRIHTGLTPQLTLRGRCAEATGLLPLTLLSLLYFHKALSAKILLTVNSSRGGPLLFFWCHINFTTFVLSSLQTQHACASCSVFQAFCAFKAATNKRETELRGTQKVRCNQFCTSCFRQRPYSVENTRSHLNSEVKQPKARSVLGWGTAWEVLRVLLAFCFKLLNSFWGGPSKLVGLGGK